MEPNTRSVEASVLSTLDSDLKDSSPVQDKSEKYCQLPKWRKYTILFTMSWMTLVVASSSTSLLPATPEISSEFSTTVEIINITSSGVLIAMGASCFVWGPISEIVGRWKAYNAAILILLGCSVGIALARDMGTFTAMRVLGGFEGTFFWVAGQTIIADIFEPTVRGRAVGFFMAGSVSGPAIGPCIGGIIVTFTSWRLIYWLQVAMVGLGLVLSLLFVPDIHQKDKLAEVFLEKRKNWKLSTLGVLSRFNPSRIFWPLIYPNVLFSDITCGLLSTYQFALLTSVRTIISPTFHLTSPLVSGLFYIAPGAGFLVGSILGGKLSDRAVQRYIIKRNGVRIPQDRLNSGLLPLFLVLPVSALLYGWMLQKKLGGLAVPIVTAFVSGMGLMGSFNGLNTYTAEVLPHKRSEVISGKYIIQYMFAAGSSAAVVPVINAIGVGWTFSICVILVVLGGFLILAIAKRGSDMQRWVEHWSGRKGEY